MDERPTIRCLPGPFEPDGSPPCLVGKPYAAFWLIALEPAGVTREDLAHFLWPDSKRPAALRSVRNALHGIRKALGPTALVEGSGSLRLAKGRVHLDLVELDAALSSGDHQRAFDLWRGGPFASFSLGGTPSFNDWADRLRARYEQRLGSGLMAEAEAALENGQSHKSLAWLSLALKVVPYNEAVHIRYVEALLDMDRLEEADAALHEAYGMAEDRSVGSLERLRDRLHRRRARRLTERVEENRPVSLEFVGRSTELARLRAEWKRARAGKARSVAVLGEVGIGKSRLAEEFVRTGVEPNVVVVRARALHSDRSVEHGLTAELARELSSCPGAAGVSNASATLLRQIVPTLGNWRGEMAVVRLPDAGLAEAMRDLLESVASEAPLLLLVDDLQWADAASRALLLRALRSIEGIPLFTVMTCRSGEANQPAVQALESEVNVGRLTFFELGPLTEPETLEALQSSIVVVPDDAIDHLVQRFFRVTQGNPLFLVELLRALWDRDILQKSKGSWSLPVERIPPELPLPQSVREVLEDRFSALSEDARLLAGVLAGNGTRLSLNPLSEEGPLSPARAEEALGELGRAGIVAMESSGRVVFTHDAVRESATRFLTPPPPRSRLRRFAGYALAPLGIVLAATLAWAFNGAVAEPPFGGGRLWVRTNDGIVPVGLPGTTGKGWTVGTARRIPPELGRPVVWSGTGDSLRIFGVVENSSGIPMGVEVTPDGGWRNLMPHDGDVNVSAVAPGGDHVLMTVADESGPTWRMDLVRMSLSSGNTAIVHRATVSPWGLWSSDGSTLLSIDNVPGDSLYLMRPDGEILASHGFASEGLALQAFSCLLPQGEALVTYLPSGGAPELRRISFFPPGETVIPAAAPMLGRGLGCSPDGTGAAFIAEVGGMERMVVQDLVTGDTILAPSGVLYVIGWTPGTPVPVPAEVEIDADSVTVAWGESIPLVARVRYSDGSSRSTSDVEWSSADSRTAYVSGEGALTGVQGGLTHVIAAVHGWLADTVAVTVDASRTPETTLLIDRFVELDTIRWVPFGDATYSAVASEGRPVLEITSNGVGTDGLRSRKWFGLKRGATLEVEYRLPPTRRDRQSFTLCLSAVVDTLGAWLGAGPPAFSEMLCFGQPIGELARFDSASFTLSGRFPSAPVSRPDLFPARDWKHITLVVAPDGEARLLVDREEIARTPYPLRFDPAFRWCVTVWGRSVDTNLQIRNLVLWDGMRY